MAAVRLSGTFRAHSECAAQTTMPGPSCADPGVVSGNGLLFPVWRCGQCLTSASTRCSCPEHTVPVRPWPRCRHLVTGLASVTVTVLTMSEPVSLAFGPVQPEPVLARTGPSRRFSRVSLSQEIVFPDTRWPALSRDAPGGCAGHGRLSSGTALCPVGFPVHDCSGGRNAAAVRFRPGVTPYCVRCYQTA